MYMCVYVGMYICVCVRRYVYMCTIYSNYTRSVYKHEALFAIIRSKNRTCEYLKHLESVITLMTYTSNNRYYDTRISV